MTKEEFRDYVDFLRSQDAISYDVYSGLIDGIYTLEEEPKWIPVSERLPKDEQEVLITFKINVKHHVWSAIWDELHGRFYDKEYRSYISLNYVTAWMPLPKSYKPQERSEEVCQKKKQ